MEIFTEASGQVKVGDIILPGFFQSMEVNGEILLDEIEVEGRSDNPKQPVGYEDAKIKMTLIVENNDTTPYEKLEVLQSIFKAPGQGVPHAYDIFNRHLLARGITKVVFKGLTTIEDNKLDVIKATCEFAEYIPISIGVKKISSKSQTTTTNSFNNSAEYRSYVKSNRGKVADKKQQTVAKDDDVPTNNLRRFA